MKIYFLACTLFLQPICKAQTVDDKNGLMWERTDPKIDDIELKFRTTGINIGGYEGTAVIINNKREQNVSLQLKIDITDLCGHQSTRTINVSVKAKSMLGGNTWMGGAEQIDYQSKCTDKKEYVQGRKTKISNVEIKILSVSNTGVTNEFKDNLEGVAVTITKNKGVNGKTNSIVRLKNNNPQKIAVVYVIADENIIYMPAHLGSGGTVTVSAGSAEQISYYVIGLLPEEAKKFDLIQQFKDFVQKKVTAPPATNGSIKGKTLSAPCMCIR